MSLIRPTRREFVASVPLLLGGTALARAQMQPQPASDLPRLRFLVVGDWGRNGKKGQQEVADAMKLVGEKHQTEFVVSTGDNFYWLGVNSTSDRKWDTSFERVYAESLGAWYPVLGNHDYGGSVEAQLQRKSPSGRWRMGKRWQVVRPPTQPGVPTVDLFLFDTVTWVGKEAVLFDLLGAKPDKKLQQEQLDEMSAALAASTADVKIAFGHYGIYSIGTHGGSMAMKELDDLLRRYRVSAWVNGHDHCLYHITHRGMHYVCSGAGSQVLPAYAGGAKRGCVTPPWCDGLLAGESAFPLWHRFLAHRPGHPDHFEGGFALFDVSAAGAFFTFYDRYAQERHRGQFA